MRGDLRTLLAGKIEPLELKMVYKSYDIVGDIAIIRMHAWPQRSSKRQ